MPNANNSGDDTVSIPRWFIWFLSTVLGLFTVGGLPWAYQISTSVTTISVQMQSINRLHESELSEIRRRLDRLESDK